MAILIRSNGEEVRIYPKSKKFTLKELQSAVGGFIEVVRIDKDFIMVMDEEGKLKCLSENHTATRLYRNVRYTDDYIVGDVLICNNEELE